MHKKKNVQIKLGANRYHPRHEKQTLKKNSFRDKEISNRSLPLKMKRQFKFLP